MATDKADLLPIDWERVEADYRAGILSVREIAKLRGLSHTAIQKRANKLQWSRDLKAKIQAKAEELVAKQAVAAEVAAGRVATDVDAVLANGAMLASVRIEHRQDVAALRVIIRGLMAELAEVLARPDLFAQVDMVMNLRAGEEDRPEVLDSLEDAMALVRSLPGRTKVAKDLADALHKCIGMEREAFGLNTAGGTDGMPLVLVKDFTGKGDQDSPFFGKPQPDSEY